MSLLERVPRPTSSSPLSWLVAETTSHAVIGLSEDRRVVAWNAGAERILGYADDEAMCLGWTDVVAPDQHAAADAALDAADRDGEGALDLSLARESGAAVRVVGAATALPSGGYAVVVREPLPSEDPGAARFDPLFAAIAEGFCVLEVIYGPDGEPTDYWFVEANPAFETHTGLTDPVGKTAHALVPGLEDHWVERYARVAETGEADRFVAESPAMGRWFEVDAVRVGTSEQRRVALLFRNVTGRHEIEDRDRRRNADLTERVEARAAEVRALTARLAVATRDERERLARVLHDDLQQQLFGLGMLLSLLRKAPPNAEAAALVDQAETMIAGAIDTTRTLAADLTPDALDSDDLADVLRWLADRTLSEHRLPVTVETEALVVPDRPLRALAYGAVRELLFNVVKHARASEAWVRARCDAGAVRVTIADDGAGFAEDARGGVGLARLRRRLEAVGGSLAVDSAPGAGARVTVTLPVPGA